MVVIATHGHVVSISNFSIWFHSTDVEKWYPDFEEHFVENTPLNVKSRIRAEIKVR